MALLTRFRMSKSFKIDPETFEETTKTKRFGNVRKRMAVEKIKERRKRKKEQKRINEWFYNLE